MILHQDICRLKAKPVFINRIIRRSLEWCQWEKIFMLIALDVR